MNVRDRARQVPLLVKYERLWRKYGAEGYVPHRAFLDNLAITRHLAQTSGAIMECGVYRGTMSAALAEALPGRVSYLLDSFEGLPDPTAADGAQAVAWIAEHGRMEVSADVARAHMDRSGSRTYEIIEGWFDSTVPDLAKRCGPISLLRLDGDLYDSTTVCLEHLAPLVVPGGRIVIDDYGTSWTGCTRAVHDWLSRHERIEAIRRTRHGVPHIVIGY